MWSSQREEVAGGVKFSLFRDDSPVSFGQALHFWQFEASFCTFFNALLADSAFSAFRWETPPICIATVTRPFEFVLLDEPQLERTPDMSAFAEQIRKAPSGASVIAFANLRNDALLVVPCPIAAASAYGHLAAFVRNAPEAQRHELWARVGTAMQESLSDEPLWLSTAGAGVSWLHVRLDFQPKYYTHAPYRATL